jgi:metallo-beta-lactamase class B
VNYSILAAALAFATAITAQGQCQGRDGRGRLACHTRAPAHGGRWRAGAQHRRGPEGTKITHGGTTIDVMLTPGHTPGTLSYLFPVHDGGRALTVAYAGGTAFNFPRDAGNFAVYRDSQREMQETARTAGAAVLMTNHTEFDRAYDRARIAQLPRPAGEKHPYETDEETVQRCFEMGALFAEAQRLSMAAGN